MRMLTVILVTLIISGCGKIYDYELKRLAEICGGYDNIQSVWLDATTARAYCKDGSLINSKQLPK